MHDWTRVLPWLDGQTTDGRLPPVICVMPDAPWSERAGYYVDSQYQGGAAIEAAYTQVLVPHIDARYRTSGGRNRVVAGYSMGGAGALRFALVRPDLFAAALVLSPAVYTPLPPGGSSARAFGAFGVGRQVFDEERYRQLGYEAALDAFDPALPIRLFITVGDTEYADADATGADTASAAGHDLDYEAAVLYNRVKRVPGIRAAFRVYGGGHNWSLWERAFREGLTLLSEPRSRTPH
jgi:S-formylglutathione hydrolase FrmB